MSHTPTWWTARLSLAAVTGSLVPFSSPGVNTALAVGWALHIGASGLDFWQQRPAPDPTLIYRLFAADGALLYVGITRGFDRRMRQHARSKPWWPQVTRTETRTYRTREKAAEAEWQAITTESPRHNGTRLSREGHIRSAVAR